MNSKEETKGIKLEYEILKDDFSRAGKASSDIKKKLRQLGLDANIIRKTAIVAYEAEINIVIHSEGGTITAFINPCAIEIVAKDKGPGIEDVELAMKVGYSTASNKIRELGFGAGMGLPNMKKFSDEFYIESQKGKSTTIRMIMKL